MTREDLIQLVEFNAWARDRMLGAVAALTPEQYGRPLGNSFPSVRDTVVHCYSAEWVWYMRCHGSSPSALLAVKDYPDAETVTRAWNDLGAKWLAYLNGLGPEEHLKVLEYRLLNGTPGRSAVWQIVQHLVNHATYHRGQVTTLLKQLGASVVGTDLIVFHRERTIS